METQTNGNSTQNSTPPSNHNAQKKESIEEMLSKPFTPLDPDAITQKYDNDYQLGASFEAGSSRSKTFSGDLAYRFDGQKYHPMYAHGVDWL